MRTSPLLTRDDARVTIAAEAYRLSWRTGSAGVVSSPYLHLRTSAGKRWMRICALSGAHTTASPDETARIFEPEVHHDGDDLVVTIETSRLRGVADASRCAARPSASS